MIIRVTASIGLVHYHQGEPIDSFIARADANLYAAKEQGRNRLVAARDAAPLAHAKSSA